MHSGNLKCPADCICPSFLETISLVVHLLWEECVEGRQVTGAREQGRQPRREVGKAQRTRRSQQGVWIWQFGVSKRVSLEGVGWGRAGRQGPRSETGPHLLLAVLGDGAGGEGRLRLQACGGVVLAPAS